MNNFQLLQSIVICSAVTVLIILIVGLLNKRSWLKPYIGFHILFSVYVTSVLIYLHKLIKRIQLFPVSYDILHVFIMISAILFPATILYVSSSITKSTTPNSKKISVILSVASLFLLMQGVYISDFHGKSIWPYLWGKLFILINLIASGFAFYILYKFSSNIRNKTAFLFVKLSKWFLIIFPLLCLLDVNGVYFQTTLNLIPFMFFFFPICYLILNGWLIIVLIWRFLLRIKLNKFIKNYRLTGEESQLLLEGFSGEDDTHVSEAIPFAKKKQIVKSIYQKVGSERAIRPYKQYLIGYDA